MHDADTAVFHCADGYFTTHPLADLAETEAFLAYQINGQDTPVHGFPLRLVSPNKYGYKWGQMGGKDIAGFRVTSGVLGTTRSTRPGLGGRHSLAPGYVSVSV